MTVSHRLDHVGQAYLRGLASRLALQLRPGDVLALSGDLGAGKTTFARAIIRSLLGDAEAEVPSPTFALVQPYETGRFPVFHYDLYRLAGASEVADLGFADSVDIGVAIVEWPERAEELFPADRLEIRFSHADREDHRTCDLVAYGTFAPRLSQLVALEQLLDGRPGKPSWRDAVAAYLQGDASPRAYARLDLAGATRILMDAPRRPDGPPIHDGKPYSRIAHLAEDVRPFVAISRALRDCGFSLPRIYAQDLGSGLLLLEDLGDRLYAREVASGTDQSILWHAAVETLAVLRRLPAPAVLKVDADETYAIPGYDHGAMRIEVELLIDWYWPLTQGAPAPAAAREEFLGLWDGVFDRLRSLPRGWMLRDYHSPNLIWLPQRQGIQRVGILDFQDALQGPPAFDLVSLLQDARVDVPVDLERRLYAGYCGLVRRDEPRFDRDSFAFSYAALGAQRNTKILGIFARLAVRDGKPGYLGHIQRIWRYVERDLAHVTLEPLEAWYDRWFPRETRSGSPDRLLRNADRVRERGI